MMDLDWAAWQDEHRQQNPHDMPDVQIQVLEGKTGPVLTQAILNAKPKVDLLLVGSRGHTGIKKAVMGSVSSYFLGEHTCTHTHTHTHAHARTHTHTHTRTHECAHKHARTHAHTDLLASQTTSPAPLRLSGGGVRVEATTHARTHAPMRACTHTHTQKGSLVVRYLGGMCHLREGKERERETH